jgi:hypothetical protein
VSRPKNPSPRLTDRPVNFLEERVRVQDGVQKWIQKVATAAWYSYWYSILRSDSKAPHSRVPKIWVCTGVHLISNAKVHSDTRSASEQSGGATLDAGLVAGGIPTGQSIAKVDVSHKSGQQADTDFNIKEYQVWAAKWFALDIDYVRPEEKKGVETYVIKLGEVEDLGYGGIREDAQQIASASSDDGRRVAVLNGLEECDSTPLARDGAELSSEVDETPYSLALDKIDHDEFKRYKIYVDCLGF